MEFSRLAAFIAGLFFQPCRPWKKKHFVTEFCQKKKKRSKEEITERFNIEKTLKKKKRKQMGPQYLSFFNAKDDI